MTACFLIFNEKGENMHQALYRKYRPNVFGDVYGQDHITSILRFEAANGAVSHAYLFSGSRGTGKTTCAKILAKSVNCLNLKDGNPCNECENCRAIDEGTTTDVLEMDAATNTGVDYIRDLRDNVMYTPSILKKRVYIIDEAHMLSDSAFNALLKTIEEPPDHVLFIFATTEQHKIPATIISRCQRFEFRRISIASLVERLSYIAKSENIEITKEALSVIAKTAQGGMRDAISLMELCAGAGGVVTPEQVNKILGTSSYDKMCSVAKSIANKEYAVLFDTINEIVSSSKDILVFFADLTSFYRDMMVVKSSASAAYLELIDSEANLVKDACSQFNMATLLYHISLLDSAYLNMQKNPSTKRLCAEITLMKMCDPKLSESNEALLSRIASLEDKITLISKGAKIDETIKQSEQKKDTTSSTVSVKETIEVPKVSTDNKTSEMTEIQDWNEVAIKVSESDQSIFGFVNKSRCYYKDGKYYLVCENEFVKNLLSTEKNKSSIFNAMMLCEIDISSVSQLEIVINIKNTAKKSGLEEF
ncbi:MAG: DNA polymerase III subunit gamma/tau [Ruminococcaceae bacterium]|nr:DNA polymerase III subunit gamma/tau [Oscillospiraceae bacterium]